ncbi:MAG: hypothetical protein IIW94_03980 [Clostridia bacterium]|nr:hypothetical protein [Clostridia bacterium]
MNKVFEILIKIMPFSEKYIKDVKARTKLFLRLGLLINVGYAVFNIFTGVFYRSVWFGAVSVYYIMLCFIKFFLLKKGFEKRGRKEYSDLFTCGIMLLILSASITAIIYLMIWQGKATEYSRLVIYVTAAYAVFRIVAALFDTVRLRHLKSPTLYAAKALSLSVALMSLFSLQFSVLLFSDLDEKIRYFLNVLSGSVVGVLTTVIAVLTIRRAYRVLKEKEKT